MQKAKNYDLADSNCANIGSAMDKAARQAAGQSEPAWADAGKAPGLQIWRIEQFSVQPWPVEQYGTFYSGDSYILLNTYKKKDTDALAWDVHFWLGAESSQDEVGTAAYKTVELDDLLDGAPIQHREVQEYESALFMSYFPKGIRLWDGGIDSAFRKVEPTAYRSRLLHLKGKKNIRVCEVPKKASSLNQGDVFILDLGMELFQWQGQKCGIFERQKAAELVRALDDERGSGVAINVIEGDDPCPEMFAHLEGEATEIKSAEEGGSDVDASKEITKKLFKLSDAGGSLSFTEVAVGPAIQRSMLDSNDVFIFDAGVEIYAWVGKGASKEEKRMAIIRAQDYMTTNNLPKFLPITRLVEGGESNTFNQAFQ
eukprot:JP446301.1.p1 GENE.JP446301.1~~JP446301.1.p1  ORF type:complete len:370 (-),score=176.59 JP446301.1:122-1231(-)